MTYYSKIYHTETNAKYSVNRNIVKMTNYLTSEVRDVGPQQKVRGSSERFRGMGDRRSVEFDIFRSMSAGPPHWYVPKSVGFHHKIQNMQNRLSHENSVWVLSASATETGGEENKSLRLIPVSERNSEKRRAV